MKTSLTIALSLIVGAFFGWALSTKFPVHAAALSGTAAAAFAYRGFVVNNRTSRRESRVRRGGDYDGLA